MISELVGHAHDLGNKLTIVHGVARIIQSKNTQAILEEPIKNLTNAIQVSHGILLRITDLLKSEGQNLDELTLRRITEHVEEIKQNVLASMQRLYNIKLTIQKDHIDFKSHFLYNQKILEQVYENIIENAHQNGATKMKIYYLVEADRFKISFEDNGPGIKSADLKLLGTGFSSKQGGQGLGTQIIAKNVKKLKGKVKWISDGQNGCVVEIELPTYKK